MIAFFVKKKKNKVGKKNLTQKIFFQKLLPPPLKPLFWPYFTAQAPVGSFLTQFSTMNPFWNGESFFFQYIYIYIYMISSNGSGYRNSRC